MKLNRKTPRLLRVAPFRNPIFTFYLWTTVKNVHGTEHVCQLAQFLVLKDFWRFSRIEGVFSASRANNLYGQTVIHLYERTVVWRHSTIAKSRARARVDLCRRVRVVIERCAPCALALLSVASIARSARDVPRFREESSAHTRAVFILFTHTQCVVRMPSTKPSSSAVSSG